MKKSFNKKLSLKKTDIATLSDSEMKSLVGGGYQSVQAACTGSRNCTAYPSALYGVC